MLSSTYIAWNSTIMYLHLCSVFYRQHKEIRDVIKKIVLHMLFDFQHLENYMLRKIRQFSSNVNIVENITQALNSPEAEKIIDDRLNDLYSQPEAHYLEVLGLRKEQLRPMIKPAVLSLCAESGPMVLDSVTKESQDQVGNASLCLLHQHVIIRL